MSQDDPNNYADPVDACESITDELEELDSTEHNDVCEIIEEWHQRGIDEDTEEETEE